MYPHEMAAVIPSMPADDPSIAQISDAAAQPASMAHPRWTPGYTLLMFSMWWLMMVAMMLPSASPMIITHAVVTRRALADSAGKGGQGIHATTTAFVSGYLVMWAVFSLVAVITQWILQNSELLSAMMLSNSRLLSSALLLAAGAWQLTPLKAACLRQCRSPVSFLASHWEPGTHGAFRMGARHGSFCVGCCWLLMALLFLGGVMNLVWIIGLAVYVLIEKLAPAGLVLGRVTGILLLLAGAWLGVTVFRTWVSG